MKNENDMNEKHNENKNRNWKYNEKTNKMQSEMEKMVENEKLKLNKASPGLGITYMALPHLTVQLSTP